MEDLMKKEEKPTPLDYRMLALLAAFNAQFVNGKSGSLTAFLDFRDLLKKNNAAHPAIFVDFVRWVISRVSKLAITYNMLLIHNDLAKIYNIRIQPIQDQETKEVDAVQLRYEDAEGYPPLDEFINRLWVKTTYKGVGSLENQSLTNPMVSWFKEAL
jgi:hypothetical protein